MFSDSFAGIAPSSAPAFVAAQVLGGAVGFGVIRLLYPTMTSIEASGVVVPRLSDVDDPRVGPAPDPDR
jgi:hypothetical protein